jgi:hypothetical protein
LDADDGVGHGEAGRSGAFGGGEVGVKRQRVVARAGVEFAHGGLVKPAQAASVVDAGVVGQHLVQLGQAAGEPAQVDRERSDPLCTPLTSCSTALAAPR